MNNFDIKSIVRKECYEFIKSASMVRLSPMSILDQGCNAVCENLYYADNGYTVWFKNDSMIINDVEIWFDEVVSILEDEMKQFYGVSIKVLERVSEKFSFEDSIKFYYALNPEFIYEHIFAQGEYMEKERERIEMILSK